MCNKKSIIFYYDWVTLINSLPDSQRLEFYDALFSEKRELKNEDIHLQSIFKFVVKRVEENEYKYNQKVIKLRENASKGGKSSSKTKQMQAIATKSKQLQANPSNCKQIERVTVTDTVTVLKENNNIKEKEEIVVVVQNKFKEKFETGISKETVLKILSNFKSKHILKNIDIINPKLIITNPVGFLIKSLQENWDLFSFPLKMNESYTENMMKRQQEKERELEKEKTDENIRLSKILSLYDSFSSKQKTEISEKIKAKSEKNEFFDTSKELAMVSCIEEFIKENNIEI